MSVDLNSLIAKPQASVIVPQPIQPVATTSVKTAPVIQQPLAADTFKNEAKKEDAKPTSALDQILKYSGVVALVATPVALVVQSRNSAKNLKTLTESIGKEVSKQVADQVSKITSEGQAFQTKIQDEVTKLTAQGEKHSGLFDKVALVIMGAFGYNIITDESEKVKMIKVGKPKPKVPEISEATVALLETEATKRIEGQYAWPKIENVKSWMVSAETQTFLKIGGLAEVGVQLPDAFNKKYEGDPNNKMEIVTPLYVGQGSKTASLKEVDGHFVYTGAEKKEINLDKTGSVPVRVYDDKKNSYKTENVDILTGSLNGTKYIFLRNDKMFGITPSKDNNPACVGAYVTNNQGVGEVERMAFFSKAVYELMKTAKEEKISGIEAPNVVMANDWHASAMSSLMRYEAPVVHEQKKMNDETYEYIKNTPVIHITHNAQYQGSDWQNADKIFRTLFEENTDQINENIKGYKEEGFPLSTGMGNYNEALSDLFLADRSIAVSGNYANELCKAGDLGCGLQDINKIRLEKGTMLGIVNGYTKSLSEPNEKMIANINKNLMIQKPFVNYEGLYNEEGYNKKLQNKAAMIEQLKIMAEKSIKGEPISTDDKSPKLYDPENCKLPADIDVSKVPFIANVGRFVEQKGYDYLVDSLQKVLKNLKPGDERPIVALLGSGDDPETMNQLKKLKDDLAKTDKVASERIFLFDGFSSGLRDGLGVASDFFLIPSKWEPCGLTQMEAMPKGSLPIATATGGLVDTIVDGEEGFLTDVFYGYKTNEKIFDNGKSGLNEPSNNKVAFAIAMNRALETFYNNPEKIKQMSINAMKKDFSWNVAGGALEQYEELMTTGAVTKKS